MLSFSRRLAGLAAARPAAAAVTCGARTLTRNELDISSNRWARALSGMGVRKDQRVAIALPNSVEFYQITVALWKIGATPLPVSSRLPRKELNEIIQLSGTPLVIGVDPQWFADRRVLPPDFTPDASISAEPLPDAVASHWKVCTSGGSTGRPKLIVDARGTVFDQTLGAFLRLPSEEAVCLPGPLYHNAAFSWSLIALLRGNHVITMPKFDAHSTLQLIDTHDISWVGLVPTMMNRIWRLEPSIRDGYDISTLRTVFHSGAPCPAWLKEAWIGWLGPEHIVEAYGGTEGQGVTRIDGVEWLQRKGSVGRAFPGCRMKICNESGQEVAPGNRGEIFFLPDSGQGSTYRYVGAEPKAIEGGWETLGDVGCVDADGYLYVADRSKDLILCGGANIYPAEVEAAIESHPAVRSSIVIGLPDDDLGQRVHAIVDAPAGLSEDALRAHLAEQIVRYKIPRSFEFVSESLRDEAGKVRRSEFLRRRSECN